jgi:hypothetical protein
VRFDGLDFHELIVRESRHSLQFEFSNLRFLIGLPGHNEIAPFFIDLKEANLHASGKQTGKGRH